MERLTIRSNNGDMVWYKDVENNDAYVEPCEMTPHHSRMAIAKLADYEDAEEHGLFLNVNAAVANIEKQRDAWNVDTPTAKAVGFLFQPLLLG